MIEGLHHWYVLALQHALLDCAERSAERVASLTDAEECRDVVREEIMRALDEAKAEGGANGIDRCPGAGGAN